MNPTTDQAFQFAMMLHCGLPAEQAILYFADTDDPATLALMLQKWTKSRLVAEASRQLDGKDWTEMSDDEKMQAAIGQHYRTLSFLLKSVNYITASQGEKAKLDSARTAIEAKLAGNAGKVDALSQFYTDVKAGKFASLSKTH